MEIYIATEEQKNLIEAEDKRVSFSNMEGYGWILPKVIADSLEVDISDLNLGKYEGVRKPAGVKNVLISPALGLTAEDRAFQISTELAYIDGVEVPAFEVVKHGGYAYLIADLDRQFTVQEGQDAIRLMGLLLPNYDQDKLMDKFFEIQNNGTFRFGDMLPDDPVFV